MDKQRAFANYGAVEEYRIRGLMLERLSGDTYRATFDKDFRLTGPRRFSGAVRQALLLKKLRGGWKIVGEQELKIYWVSKDGPGA